MLNFSRCDRTKKGLQNEKGLDKYIDRILTEKAEKKKPI